jgi:hypothetical protein
MKTTPVVKKGARSSSSRCRRFDDQYSISRGRRDIGEWLLFDGMAVQGDAEKNVQAGPIARLASDP